MAHPQPSVPRVLISSLIYSVRPVYVSSRLIGLRQRINTLKINIFSAFMAHPELSVLRVIISSLMY